MVASFPSTGSYSEGVTRSGPGYTTAGNPGFTGANLTGYSAGAAAGVGDALVPEPLATGIIQELPKKSAALQLCKRTVLSSKTERMPVLDVLPQAYWVGGDTGLKSTSQQQWKNVVMVVEELACIIPIPQAYLDDADVPIWDEVQPRMTEAAGALIDQAVIWDINKPATWGTSIMGGIRNSGNYVASGTNMDFGADVAALGDNLAQTGYNVNGFIGRPGLAWKLAGLRSSQGLPIYGGLNAPMSNAPSSSLFGYPIAEVDNGSFQRQEAELIAGDWSKAIIGVRQDISFKLFTEGVISDNNGAVVLNLMQQDAVAMRMVMRLAYATVNPVTIMQPNKQIAVRWPFGAVVQPTALGAVNTTGSVAGTSGTNQLTGVTNATPAWVGSAISGTGVPAGTTVVGVQGQTLTLSANLTAAASGTYQVGGSTLPAGVESQEELEEGHSADVRTGEDTGDSDEEVQESGSRSSGSRSSGSNRRSK